MRIDVIVSFWAHHLPGGAPAILGAAGCEADLATISGGWAPGQIRVEVALPPDDERIARLEALLTGYDQPYSLGYVNHYTDEELDNARLLLLYNNCECDVAGGSKYGTTYDLTGACPVCGAGARQNSALFLLGDREELFRLEGHRAALTYRGEVFVDERLAEQIENLGPTGLVTHSVYTIMPDNRQKKLRWKQLSSDRILPRMHPLTTAMGMSQPCAVCPRSGYRTGPTTELPGIAYRASDLEGAGDVNLTWEGEGNGELHTDPRQCWLPIPWLLVTPKVMRVLRNAGVTEFAWKPIHIIDD